VFSLLAMSSANPWTWDPVRQAYYIYNQVDGIYVYADGSTVDSTGNVISPGSASRMSGSSVIEAAKSVSNENTGPRPSVGSASYISSDPKDVSKNVMDSLHITNPSSQWVCTLKVGALIDQSVDLTNFL
jgi:hypothetical protein